MSKFLLTVREMLCSFHDARHSDDIVRHVGLLQMMCGVTYEPQRVKGVVDFR